VTIIDPNRALAKELGITGTLAFVVGNELVPPGGVMPQIPPTQPPSGVGHCTSWVLGGKEGAIRRAKAWCTEGG
jgi:hypothetical protein